MDDKLKQQIFGALIAFNLTLIVYQLAFNWGKSFTITKLMLGLVASAAAAGITYGVMRWKGA